MKVEELKKLQIRPDGGENTLDCDFLELCTEAMPNDEWAACLTVSRFENPERALLAAARFRASEMMYRALDRAETLIDSLFKQALDYDEAKKILSEVSAAIALADNTNEVLPCNKSCSPSDWSATGKCGQKGCYHQ